MRRRPRNALERFLMSAAFPVLVVVVASATIGGHPGWGAKTGAVLVALWALGDFVWPRWAWGRRTLPALAERVPGWAYVVVPNVLLAVIYWIYVAWWLGLAWLAVAFVPYLFWPPMRR